MSKRSASPNNSNNSNNSKRPRLQPVRRPRLTNVKNIQDAIKSLQSAKNIMVLVGAGISVSCGVPDFRSENGLYALAQRLGLELNDPQELFDINFFDDDEGANFYKFAHALWPRPGINPSPTHRFLSALDRKGRLLRVYTQNIDGLETKASISTAKIVECHGSLLTASCRGSSCRAVCAAADLSKDVEAHQVPRCMKCGGVWKPDVTFFGEPLVARVGKTLEADREKADLLLVIGTSLQVAPISKVMGWLPHDIPQILINMDVVHPPRATTDGFDVSLIGEADVVVAYLAAAMKIDINDRNEDEEKDVEKSKSDVVARGPDVVVSRGAVWAPQASMGTSDGKKFVDTAAGLLSKDAADLIVHTTVTCDVCSKDCGVDVFVCQTCFGYDLCSFCHGSGEAEKHAVVEGSTHTFVREER